MYYNDRQPVGASAQVSAMQAAVARAAAPAVRAASIAAEAAARPHLDAIAHKVSAAMTPHVQSTFVRAVKLAQPPSLLANMAGSQLARIWQPPQVWQPPRWWDRSDLFPSFDVGYLGAPTAILEIMQRLAELRTLPRLKGLTRRASQPWFDLYDALHAFSREAVASFVDAPVDIPRRYRRRQCERAKILRIAVISPHRRVENSIGHLQIRAPGSSDFALASRHSLVLIGENTWMRNSMVSSRPLTPA